MVAPFDLRIANLGVEADQYIGVGQTLFEGDSVDRVEMDIQVPLSALRRLFLDLPTADRAGAASQPVDPTQLNALLPEARGTRSAGAAGSRQCRGRMAGGVRAHGR